MKTILCYGDSNTWGYIPNSMVPEFLLASRLQRHERWPEILNDVLGRDEFHVIGAGLNGRTTAFDEKLVVRASRNGLLTLPPIIEMHYPLDMVILMLGTNDCKIQYKANASMITENMAKIIDYIQQSHFGKDFKAPKVMLVCPAPLKHVDIPAFTLYFNDDSINLSHELDAHYSALAKEKNCLYLNAGDVVNSSDLDGVHIDAASQFLLARTIKNKMMESGLIR